MGIWIRSQDKTILKKCDIVVIDKVKPVGYSKSVYLGSDEFHKEEYKIKFCTDNIEITLGFYSTKEKALNVLDMIENFINNLERYVIESDNYSDVHSLRKVTTNSIFQMPLDNEVE